MRAGAVDLTQKLLPFNVIATNTRLQRTSSPFSFLQQPYRMAEAAGSANIPAPHPIQPKPNENRPKMKEIPPPPEKPEPGDCCGSGCVRCVWDIYYEELEQYNNKLYKQENPDPNPNPKP